MKHCINCNKEVNVIRNQVNIGIADIWNDHCEECGNFVDSGIIVDDEEIENNIEENDD